MAIQAVRDVPNHVLRRAVGGAGLIRPLLSSPPLTLVRPTFLRASGVYRPLRNASASTSTSGRSTTAPAGLGPGSGSGFGSRGLSSSCNRWSNATTGDHPQLPPPEKEGTVTGTGPQQIGQIEPRLSLTFTCTANDCGHRSTHEFAKRSYEKGIVLVQCPECKSRHLIADHIGWFKESTEDGKHRTVEDLLRAKGEAIRKGRVNFDGDIEYDGES